ncbi:porin family protein [Pasteurellaceae bacterium LIM206]|nr:porin family protein [Pasteurellaceae bacterium LIM206]
MKRRYFIYVATLCSMTGSIALADMQEQDALRLWRQHEQQSAQRQQERQAIGDEQPADEITLEGQSFEVEHNVDAVGQALYIALNRQLWGYAEKFLAQYETFPEHKPELVWFAKGALAREHGELAEAERNYRALLHAEPDFLRGQLDLARILFENKNNQEASALFQQVSRQPLPDGVLLTLREYQHALEQRESWQGSFSLGYQYNKNINQSSQKETCLLQRNNQCVINRHSPAAINPHGWRYDLTARRRISLSGHHGAEFYVNSYGQFYPHHHDFNENTVKLYGGYSFQNANTDVTIAPVFEYSDFNNHRHYHGWGGHIEWTQLFSPRHMANIQFEQKKLRYSNHYSAFDSADLTSLFATWYYSLSPRTTLFGGVDWLYRHTADNVQSYHMPGVRFGLNHRFDFGLDFTILTLLRHYHYQGYHAALELSRKDNQQIYLAVLKMPQWQFKGITPNLLIKHTRNRSNADYVFSYKQSEVQLNFEWRF